jgi:hypothetical protein
MLLSVPSSSGKACLTFTSKTIKAYRTDLHTDHLQRQTAMVNSLAHSALSNRLLSSSACFTKLQGLHLTSIKGPEECLPSFCIHSYALLSSGPSDSCARSRLHYGRMCTPGKNRKLEVVSTAAIVAARSDGHKYPLPACQLKPLI